MKRCIFSLILVCVLLCSIIPLQAFAVGESVQSHHPVYLGSAYAEVDYMVDRVLAEIPTEGKSDREKLRAVYVWLEENCTRSSASTVHSVEQSWAMAKYFTRSEVEAALPAYKAGVAAAVQAGTASYREDLVKQMPTSSSQDSTGWHFDENRKIYQFALELLLTRDGNCAHFSSLFAVMAEHLGFDARLINGYFHNSNGTSVVHVWNYIRIDDAYVWFDVRIDHASYTRTGKLAYDYFCITDEEAWCNRHSWVKDYSDYLKKLPGGSTAVDEETETDPVNAVDDTFFPLWGSCSSWAETYLINAQQMGLIPTVLCDADMSRPMTRKEFAAVAVAMYEVMTENVAPTPGASPFTDTDDVYVLQAAKLGIVNGVGNGKFAPDATLTREQAAAMLGRVYELYKYGKVGDGTRLKGKAAYKDFSKISQFALYYVTFFSANGVIDGFTDGTFRPKDTVTREQALKIADIAVCRLS